MHEHGHILLPKLLYTFQSLEGQGLRMESVHTSTAAAPDRGRVPIEKHAVTAGPHHFASLPRIATCTGGCFNRYWKAGAGLLYYWLLISRYVT